MTLPQNEGTIGGIKATSRGCTCQAAAGNSYGLPDDRPCREQDFVSDATQAAQPEPVEPENALRVWKSHLTFLRSRRDCSKASVLANARTRSRTSSLRSRVSLRIVVVVRFGLDVIFRNCLIATGSFRLVQCAITALNHGICGFGHPELRNSD